MAARISPEDLSDDIFLVHPGKWTMVVITHLADGKMRFSELQRSIDGISQKILTGTLRELERDGAVDRTQYATIPPRVEYALTDVGRGLLDFAMAWREFVSAHYLEIELARQRYDNRSKTAAPQAFRTQ